MAIAQFDKADESGAGDDRVVYLDAVLGLAAVQAYKRRAIELLELRPGSSVLDVGCGAGADLPELAHAVGPAGTVVGVDNSESLLAEARQRTADLPMVECGVGDATKLDLPSSAFDACKADRLLQHLGDPSRAFAELVRVVRRGARIVVSDTDWGSLVVASDDRATTRKILEFHCDSAVRQGWIGRQLWTMARDSRLTDLVVEPATAVVTNFAEADQLLGLTAAAVGAVANGAIDADDASGWLASLERSADAGTFLAALTAFTVAGRKP
jgi:SAM-dependent methyltransferase